MHRHGPSSSVPAGIFDRVVDRLGHDHSFLDDEGVDAVVGYTGFAVGSPA